MSKILYCTSFNDELFLASGKKLLESFSKFKISGSWCIGYEGFKISEYQLPSQTLCISLDNNTVLKDLFDTYIDTIPDYLGGNFKSPCKCSKPWGKRDDAHEPGCPFTWWNRNWIRWFRKVLTLANAKRFTAPIDTPENQQPLMFDYLIWLDSDCIFRRKLPEDAITNILEDKDVFYMKGRRKVIETGIIGFNLKRRGGEIIERWLEGYIWGAFRELPRWDDGYVFDYMMKHTTAHYKATWDQFDIIPPNINDTDVSRYSLLSRYVVHQKGTHGRIMGIMK